MTKSYQPHGTNKPVNVFSLESQAMYTSSRLLSTLVLAYGFYVALYGGQPIRSTLPHATCFWFSGVAGWILEFAVSKAYFKRIALIDALPAQSAELEHKPSHEIGNA